MVPWNSPRLRHIPALVACAAAAMASPASAQVFSDLDTDHTWHIGGRLWVRTFPDESGWWVPLSDTEDYVLWHVDDDLVLDWTDGIDLTGRDDLTDHGIARCSDGGYLHVGTRDAVDMYGDIQLTAFDADFEEVETITVIKQGDLEWGFMRPWISCRDDQVVVSFDHNNDQVTFLASVTLDLEALGVDTSGADPASYGDCVWPLPGEPGDDDDDDDTDGPHLTPPAADDCACRAPSAEASAGPTMLLLVTLMAAAVARLTRRI